MNVVVTAVKQGLRAKLEVKFFLHCSANLPTPSPNFPSLSLSLCLPRLSLSPPLSLSLSPSLSLSLSPPASLPPPPPPPLSLPLSLLSLSLSLSLPPSLPLQFARLEFVSLLSSLVKCYPRHPRFSDMATHLFHEDREVDFFENIRHLQLHRRTRAMRRLAAACRDGRLGPHSMTGLLVPLANQVVFHSTSNVEQNLVAESVNVISGMCSQVKWTKYSYFLRHYLRLLTKKSDVHKTLVR